MSVKITIPPIDFEADGYLRFSSIIKTGQKTAFVMVTNDDGQNLGHIAWFGRWRQYCFFPAANCIFHVGCLESINRKIKSLMDERRRAREV